PPVGHQNWRPLRPAVAALGEANFLGPEWLAVGGGRVVLVRGAVADVAVEDDERGMSLRVSEAPERLLDALEVVGVGHAQDVPAVAQESGGDVLREGEARLTFSRGV